VVAASDDFGDPVTGRDTRSLAAYPLKSKQLVKGDYLRWFHCTTKTFLKTPQTVVKTYQSSVASFTSLPTMVDKCGHGLRIFQAYNVLQQANDRR
jgi:hypothetical protein